MMAILLSDGILLVGNELARASAFQRAVPHDNLARIPEVDVRTSPADAFGRGQRTLLDRRRLDSRPHRVHDAGIGLLHLLAHRSSPLSAPLTVIGYLSA